MRLISPIWIVRIHIADYSLLGLRPSCFLSLSHTETYPLFWKQSEVLSCVCNYRSGSNG